jgi:DNA-binding MarR family transcriptional regulator
MIGTTVSTDAIFIALTSLPTRRPSTAPGREGRELRKFFLSSQSSLSSQSLQANGSYAPPLLNDVVELDRRNSVNPQGAGLGRMPRKDRSHTPDYALALSIRHPIKYEALVVLQEGEYSSREIADLIGFDIKTVDGHVKELLKAGCIELAGYKQEGRRAAVYRAVVPSEIPDEVARTMTAEERHDISGAVAQAILAEIMSGYRNGKLDEDPVTLWWDARHLDSIGQSKMHALFRSTRELAKEIVVESTLRMAESGKTGQMTFFGLLNFERGRSGRPKGGSLETGDSE